MSRRRHQLSIGTFSALLLLAIGPQLANAATKSWAFETAFYEFGSTPAAQGPTEAHEFVLTDTGTTPITISHAVLNVGVGHSFYIVENTCKKEVVLEPASSCHMTVSFSPATSGRKHGYIHITAENEEPWIAEVNLEGEGTGPAVSIEPDHLEFGSVQEGSTSSAQTITVENQGSEPLTIHGVSPATWDYWNSKLEYPAATPFRLRADSCKEGGVLAEFATCTIEVAFVPSKTGTFGSILSIEDTGEPGPSQTVQFAGTGVARPPTTPAGDSSPTTGTTSGTQTGSPQAAPAAMVQPHHPYLPPAALWGTYVATKVFAGGHKTPFAKISEVSIDLEQGDSQGKSDRQTIGWKARCNSVGGDVRVTPKQLVPVEIASTAMGCPRQQGNEDRWLNQFFKNRPAWHLNGDRLILKARKRTLWLRRSSS